MTTKEKNKVIADWLGVERIGGSFYFWKKIPIPYDFLNDRNQQKLIENKLIELNCDIRYNYSSKEKDWKVTIISGNKWLVRLDESKNTAFIDAVIDLIERS